LMPTLIAIFTTPSLFVVIGYGYFFIELCI